MELSSPEIRNKYPVFKEALKNNPEIISMGTTSTPIGVGSGKVILLMETSEGMVEKGINLLAVDPDFVKTMNFEFLEGRNFSEEYMADSLSSVIVNETLAKRMNWDNPIGKKVQMFYDTVPSTQVIGLIKDYHQTGLYNEIESLLWFYRNNNYMLHIRIDPSDTKKTIRFIEQEWLKLFPDMPFEYSFLEDEINAQVQGDENRGMIFSSFSILAVIIACLGLFGLSSFTIDQRKKEIVMRKVLGADFNSIVLLLTKEFLLLVFISILIAVPLAYWYLNLWLQDYTYKTELSVAIFTLSAIITLFITLLTVSYHTVAASRANPAEALSYE
jgi:putative ABC transport system permease protein